MPVMLVQLKPRNSKHTNPRDCFVMRDPWFCVEAFYFETFPRFKKMFFFIFSSEIFNTSFVQFPFCFPIVFYCYDLVSSILLLSARRREKLLTSSTFNPCSNPYLCKTDTFRSLVIKLLFFYVLQQFRYKLSHFIFFWAEFVIWFS